MTRSKIYLSLSIMIFSAFGFAAGEDPRPGLSAGARVCASLYTATDQMECTRAMADGFVFDADVARLCAEMITDNDKYHCVRNAAGKAYTAAQVQACGEDARPSSVIHCLAGAGARVEPYPFRVEREYEMQYANRLCNSIDSGALRWQCVNALVRGKVHTPEAVDLCETFSTESDQVACLTTIAGQAISAGEVLVCARQYTTNEKYQCLRQVNRRHPWSF